MITPDLCTNAMRNIVMKIGGSSIRKKIIIFNNVGNKYNLTVYAAFSLKDKDCITLVKKRVARRDRRNIRLANPYLIDLCLVIEHHDRESHWGSIGAQLRRARIPGSSCTANGS